MRKRVVLLRVICRFCYLTGFRDVSLNYVSQEEGAGSQFCVEESYKFRYNGGLKIQIFFVTEFMDSLLWPVHKLRNTRGEQKSLSFIANV